MGASPNPLNVHVDGPLSDLAVAYLQDPARSVARRAFPVVNVAKQSDKYFVWTAADLMRTDAKVRAPGTQAAERDFGISTSSYYCDVRAIAHNLSKQTVANSDLPNLEGDIVKALLNDMLIAEERAFSAVAFANSWGTYATPSTAWSNAAAYPINDLATGIRTVLINTGRRPNVLVLGADTWYKGLAIHEDLVDRLPDNAPRIITPGFVQNLLGLDEVLISEVAYNSAVEGIAASNAFAATGTSALLLHRAPASGMAATGGITFAWTGLAGPGVQVLRYDVPLIDAAPRIEVESAVDFVVAASALGYLFYTCVS